MKRDILNYLDQKIGELELPDNTPDYVWEEKLAPYKVAPFSSEQAQSSYLEFTIKQRKEFADSLLERFKKRNIEQGINAFQGFWLHHRMRALEVSFYNTPFTVDVLNMAISGDIEIACLSLMFSASDDGSVHYHWLTDERKGWLINEMKTFLGWS